ncbi:hypothetical protein KAR91_19715 [Candidatus Pacearchaeota archaeon]|nr:hypothetical protein [Candidatus Pacearchaeota archaeon]
MKYLNVGLIFILLAVLSVLMAGIFDCTHHLAVMAYIGVLSLVSCPLLALLFLLSGWEGIASRIMFGLLIASLVGIAIGAVSVLSGILGLILGLT